MKEKINIAELLRDCPKGMELNCTTWENVTFEKVVNDLIYIKRNNKNAPFFDKTIVLNKYGCCTDHKDEKCRIFPKDKNTWEGFHRPFKDGDIVTWEDRGSLVAFIYKERKDVAVVKHHFALYTGSLGIVTTGEISLVESEIVFATEEEKQKLFDAIKANGYKWNAETKTLYKLIDPKFKVGDRIKNGKDIATIVGIYEDFYDVRFDSGIGSFTIDLQDEWELCPNKFDINTLVPFESKVLVRNSYNGFWQPTFWGIYEAEKANEHYYRCYLTTKGFFRHCIPYNDDTKHLLGTTDDCEEYYKTW